MQCIQHTKLLLPELILCFLNYRNGCGNAIYARFCTSVGFFAICCRLHLYHSTDIGSNLETTFWRACRSVCAHLINPNDFAISLIKNNSFSMFSYQRHKSMFIIFILLTVASFSSVRFISPIVKTTQLEYHCNDGISDLKFCPSSLDHCAADLFLQNSNKNATKEYTFDVSHGLVTFNSMYNFEFYQSNRCTFSYNAKWKRIGCGISFARNGWTAQTVRRTHQILFIWSPL